MFQSGVFRLTLLLVVVAAAAAVLLARVDPAVVERAYARGLYPAIGQAIGGLTGRVAFSVTEPGAAVLGVGLGYALAHGWRQPRLWVALVGGAAFGWLVFQSVWGVNYRREPIALAFRLDVRPSSVAELRALGTELAAAINTTAAWSGGDDAVAEVLREGPRIFAEADVRYPFLAGSYAPPKPLIGSELLSWLGLLGFYNPYTAEPNINVRAPAFVIPFVVLHEMAHARGVASEDEASFVGYLLGRDSGDPRFRYSALWEAVTYVGAALRGVDPVGATAFWDGLSPRVRADTETYGAWREAHASPLQALARAVNDTYLRSQGVADGVHSYGRVTDLVLAEWRSRNAGP